MTTTETLASLFIVLASSGAWAFVVLFGALAPWYRSREGRHMMTLTLGLAILGTLSIVRRVLGEWSWYDEFIVVVYGVLGWELWRRVYLFLSAQVKEDEKSPPTEAERENQP